MLTDTSSSSASLRMVSIHPKKKKGVAIEDSLNGVLAAKSARMKCIAVPEVGMAAEKRSKFSFADAVIDSLAQLDDTIWGILV